MELFIIIFSMLFSIFISITIHELGHYFAARLLNVRVKEISIGIGPKLFSFKFKNTWLSFRIIPIVAYVLIDSQKLINLYSEALSERSISFEEKTTKIINKNSIYYKFLVWNNVRITNNYTYFSNPTKSSFLIDSKIWWEKNIIYFAGIFLNAIVFLIFYLVQYFAFNYYGNPYSQIGESFLIMFKNMAFLDTSNNTIFGSIIDANNNGNLGSYNIPLIIINYLAVFNLMIFFYNLIPLPPLDGYKIFSITIERIFHIKINKKFETCLTIIGVVILCYIFLTTVIANIRFS